MTELEIGMLEARWADLGVSVSRAKDAALVVRVDETQSLALLSRLRDEAETSMRCLVDLTAIDRADDSSAASLVSDRRFEVVYLLAEPGTRERMRVVVPVAAEEPAVDSVVGLWPGANWLEREVFDLFGIRFRSHPDLRRLLLESDFEGAPLRKDYPRQPNLPLPKEASS